MGPGHDRDDESATLLEFAGGLDRDRVDARVGEEDGDVARPDPGLRRQRRGQPGDPLELSAGLTALQRQQSGVEQRAHAGQSSGAVEALQHRGQTVSGGRGVHQPSGADDVEEPVGHRVEGGGVALFEQAEVFPHRGTEVVDEIHGHSPARTAAPTTPRMV
ncbi:hypothetical protein GCM10017774_41090 [Lentzea cavernae]|uniref:Uncharacterized protein n=1 Tax=Lentzea cavernae TaxID=2020703 RepID=A0ABQ3MQE2_9PSEU|nr:hypothetical protein GCM10017774_41090 [Lentzea cavernae]